MFYTQIPQGDIDALPGNFLVNNLLSMVVLHDDADSGNVECDICDSGDPPVNRYTTCSHFLCEFCTQAHLRGRSTSSHGLVSLDEAKKMGSVAVAKPALCKEHKGEVMKLFCFTCDEAICRDCTVVTHREHSYTFVKDAYSEQREKLLTVLSEAKAKVPLLEGALKSISEMKTNVQSHAEQTVQEVTKCCEELQACVNIRRERLIHTTDELKDAKLKALQIQEKELEMALGRVQNSVEFTERALKNGIEVEVLNMHKRMSSRLQELNEAKWTLQPCTDDVVRLHVNQNQLKQEMKNFGAISDVAACAAQSTVAMENGLEGVMYDTLCGEKITFTVIAKEQNGKKRRGGGDIFEAEICHGRSVAACMNIKDGGDGTYTFFYTPEMEGQYKLSVKLSNCHIKGSPFKLTVDKLTTRYSRSSTVTMGHGKERVMYDTLCGQLVEFTLKTKEKQQMKKHRSPHEVFEVAVNQPFSRNAASKLLELKDEGYGRYSFCYTPLEAGLHKLQITVGGIHLQGSPFEWNVKEWNLTVQPKLSFSWKSFLNVVDENKRAQYARTISFGAAPELTAVGSVTFSAGKHSWKIRLLMDGISEGFGIGVVRCGHEVEVIQNGFPKIIEEETHYWFWSSDSMCYHITHPERNVPIKEVQKSPFPNNYFGNNDVIELYLDCDNGTLQMYNRRTERSFTWTGVRGRVSPMFKLCSNGDEVSLRV